MLWQDGFQLVECDVFDLCIGCCEFCMCIVFDLLMEGCEYVGFVCVVYCNDEWEFVFCYIGGVQIGKCVFFFLCQGIKIGVGLFVCVFGSECFGLCQFFGKVGVC